MENVSSDDGIYDYSPPWISEKEDPEEEEDDDSDSNSDFASPPPKRAR
jgi:hypothetical protein